MDATTAPSEAPIERMRQVGDEMTMRSLLHGARFLLDLVRRSAPPRAWCLHEFAALAARPATPGVRRAVGDQLPAATSETNGKAATGAPAA